MSHANCEIFTKYVKFDLYGRHPVVFNTKRTARIQSNTTQVCFNSTGCPYMHAACCGLYLGSPQACQYKNHTKEDTKGLKGPFVYRHYFNMLKRKLYIIKKYDLYKWVRIVQSVQRLATGWKGPGIESARKRTEDYEPRVNLTSDTHVIVHRWEVLTLES